MHTINDRYRVLAGTESDVLGTQELVPSRLFATLHGTITTHPIIHPFKNTHADTPSHFLSDDLTDPLVIDVAYISGFYLIDSPKVKSLFAARTLCARLG